MLRLRFQRLGLAGLIGCAACMGGAAPARGQQPPDSDSLLRQDEFDFQGRSSIVRGSGARALGMGGAFLARPDDATAASWNPAGLSYLRRPEVTLVWGHESFDNETRTRLFDEELGRPVDVLTFTDNFSGTAPDLLAAAYPVQIGAVSGATQLSFQRVLSFSHTRDIERFPSTPLHFEGSGGLDVLALGTGLQVSRTLRIGGTLNRWFNGFRQTRERLERRRTFQNTTFDMSGWNVNLGLIWTPVESLNLGAVGKTPFTAKVRLRRDRTDITSGTPDVFTFNEHESDAVRLEFPGALGFGASWRPWSPLTLSADYTRSFWSGGRIRNFFTLPKVEPGQPSPFLPPDNVFPSRPFPSVEDDVQRDTEQIRFGVEYVLIWGGAKIPLRAGYFNDRQHFVANLDRRPPRFDGFTGGTGLLVGPVLLDVAYVIETSAYPDANQTGDPTRTSVRFSRVFVSLIYRHGLRR